MGQIEDNTTLKIMRYYTNSVDQKFFRIIKLILLEFKNKLSLGVGLLHLERVVN